MPVHDQVTIIKDFSYRGTLEEWSNSYSLTGTTPTTDAAWKTLFDAIITSEKRCYMSASRTVRAIAYKAGEDHATYSFDYLGAAATVAGVLVKSTGESAWAGDQAAWIRGRVGSSPNGKPKYVRKYYHGGCTEVNQPDLLSVATKANYLLHAGTMTDGTLPGSMKWCGPDGTVAASLGTSVYTTTRTLKRRGRRPTPAP